MDPIVDSSQTSASREVYHILRAKVPLRVCHIPPDITISQYRVSIEIIIAEMNGFLYT